MNVLVVVNHLSQFPHEVAGATVVSARSYLTDASLASRRGTRVFNLCRVDRYQSRGYYVSLLAEARGHQPLPEAKTLGDLALGIRPFDQELADAVRQAFAEVSDARVVVDSFFGKDPLGRYDGIANLVFAKLRTPLARVTFSRDEAGWSMDEFRIQSVSNLTSAERCFLADAMGEYVLRNKPKQRGSSRPVPTLAILHTPDEPDTPSNPEALARFAQAADALGMRSEFINRTQIDRLGDFDALLIRDTTRTEHYTYQFSRRAAADGLVVVDDPESILKCSNKVFLHELLHRHQISTPKTMMVHSRNASQVISTLGLPCILKQPDSAFSLGVWKLESREDLEQTLQRMFTKSELLIAQEWLPTKFDWRVGVFDRRAIYVCKYFMAAGHWQVIKRDSSTRTEGSTACLTVGEAPEIVVKTALRAANLLGDGLYGVDLKQTDDGCYVIEVNDNPNIDAGNEDALLNGALYREIVGTMLRRVRDRRNVVK